MSSSDVARQPSSVAGRWGLTEEESLALAGRRVLWIEDYETTLEWGMRLCRACSIDAVGARTAADGIRLAMSNEVDAIVLDLVLGRDRGTTVLRSLQAAGSQVPIIVLTAHGSEETAFEVARLGACRYLSKPVDSERMVRELASIVIARSRTRLTIWNPGCRRLVSIRRAIDALDGRGTDFAADGPWRSASCRAAMAAVLDPALTDLVIWYACLDAFRRLFDTRSTDLRATAARARDGLAATIAPRRPLSPTVRDALTRIERAGAGWETLGEETMAGELGRSRARFSAALVKSTGLTFPAWRRGSAFRGALRALVETDESIKAIAGRQGYAHTAHMARHVEMHTGMGPAAFRAAARGYRLQN